MIKAGKLIALVGALALAAPSAAHADGFKSYKVCGGGNFATCAAISITVVGSNVQVRVWNLSGNTAATYGTNTPSGTVFNGIGFYNTGGSSAVLGTLSMSGPARAGDTPQSWKLRNNGKLNFGVDFATLPKNGNVGDNSLSSGCAASGQIATSLNVFENPCSGDLSNSNNWVTFSFKITGTWDPTTSDVILRGLNTSTGVATECWTGNAPGNQPSNCTTVTPEPVSMTLLATGLAGMGGMGVFRRKKKNTAV
ncbi:MAG: PEP-CTERM sorting domain-containing protein [Gemmatimonadales bacterium]